MSIRTPSGEQVEIIEEVYRVFVRVRNAEGITGTFDMFNLEADGGLDEILSAVRTVRNYWVSVVQADEPSENSERPMTGAEVGRSWPWLLAGLQAADIEQLTFVIDLTKVTVQRIR